MSAPARGSIKRTAQWVHTALREHAMLRPGERALVAVSGGPDSLALLLLLAVLRPKHGAELIAAHIDHGIRSPEERAADRDLVAATADRLGIPFDWVAADVAARASGRSPEEAARLARYTALAELAAQHGAAAVATGHTRDDQAETVLLRLLRGSGLHGLSAMTPVAPWPVFTGTDLRLVRPLLKISRAETVAYCAYHGVDPRHDIENDNPRYTRNRIRHDLLPALRGFNPRIEDALLNLADEAAALSALAIPTATLAPTPDAAGEIKLRIPDLLALPQPARVHLFRAALGALNGGRPVSRAALQRLEHLATTPTSHTAPLGDGLTASREGDRLLISPHRPAPPAPVPDGVPVALPGVTVLGPWRVTTHPSDGPPAWDAAHPWRVRLAPHTVAHLTAGPRQPGDRIAQAGLGGSKKLQDLFVDAKLPRTERERIPVFRTPRGIAWVAGFRPAAWALEGGPPSVSITVESSSE